MKQERKSIEQLKFEEAALSSELEQIENRKAWITDTVPMH